MRFDTWSDVLRCPQDLAELRAADESLVCSACGQRFPIEDGVICFLRENEAAALDENQRREIKARDEAAERYAERFSALRNRIEMPPCLDAMALGPSDVVAELGCGTGRFTLAYAEKVQRVVALDFSGESLRVLRRQLPARLADRVLLVHADMCAPPLAHGAFTRLASFQAIEHLPGAEARRRGFVAAGALLAPGGSFTFTVYHWSWYKRWLARRGIGDNTRKEGFHAAADRIYYFNFEDHNVRELLKLAGLSVDFVRGLQLQVPGIDLLGGWALWIDRLLTPTRLGRLNSHLLLARAYRR
jgi:SAM-dependent methyltransferase